MNQEIISLVKKLESLIEESEQAFEEDDNYDRVQALGKEIAQTSEAISNLPPEVYAPFRPKIEALAERISQMQENAGAEREQLRNEIIKLMKGSKGRRIYSSMNRRGKTGKWGK